MDGMEACVYKKNADVSIQSIAVVLWHENKVSSVACQPLAFRFSYPTLWPQNMCLRPLGLTSKHWIHWQTRHRPSPGGPLGPAGRSTCYSWRCSSAWCCPSSSVAQPCCSVWCSRGRCTGSAVCYWRPQSGRQPECCPLEGICSIGSKSWRKRSRSQSLSQTVCPSGNPFGGNIRAPRPKWWWQHWVRPLHGSNKTEHRASAAIQGSGCSADEHQQLSNPAPGPQMPISLKMTPKKEYLHHWVSVLL